METNMQGKDKVNSWSNLVSTWNCETAYSQYSWWHENLKYAYFLVGSQSRSQSLRRKEISAIKEFLSSENVIW